MGERERLVFVIASPPHANVYLAIEIEKVADRDLFKSEALVMFVRSKEAK
jgi:hypothetical protein